MTNFAPKTYRDYPAGQTPILAADLNRLESAVAVMANAKFIVEQFGAVGDGVTNDTTAIRAAEAAALASGCGLVFFSGGNYVCDGLLLDTGITYDSPGYDAATLTLTPSSNSSVMITAGFAGLTGGGTAGGPHGFAVRNLTIDANKANNTSGYGLRIYGFDYALHNLRVRNAATTNIYSEWGAVAGTTSPDNCEAHWTNVKTHDGVTGGIDFQGPDDSQFVNVISYNNGSGFGIKTSNNGTGAQFVNCHSWGASQVWAWQLLASGALLANCEGEGAGSSTTTGGQVLIDANDCSIVGGHYFSAGVHSNGVRGIVIGSSNTPAGTHVDTKVTSCEGGAFDFTHDGGGRYSASVYQNASPLYVGTPASGSELLLTHTGGAATHPASGLTRLAAVTTSALTVLSAGGKTGSATLSGGKVQIFTGAITANSLIFLTPTVPGGTTGVLCARNIGGTDRSAGNWFFVSSMKTDGTLQSADSSQFSYLLVEPS